MPRNISHVTVDSVGDQGSLGHEASVSASHVVVQQSRASSQSSVRSGPSDRVADGGQGSVRSKTGGQQAAGGQSGARSRPSDRVVDDGSQMDMP